MSGLMNNNEKRVYSLLGLCQKGGYTGSGEFQTEKHVKMGLSCLVIVANDSSDNTKKKFRNTSDYYKVPYYEFGNKEELGRSIGCEYRACVSVNNKGLADKIISLIEGRKTNNCE